MGPKKQPKPSRWQPLPENSVTMQATVVPGLDDHTVRIEDLSKEDLENCSKFIDESNRTIEVENNVIEKYLLRMDPIMLLKMEQALEAAAIAMQRVERAQLVPGTFSASITSAKGDDSDYTSSSRSGISSRSLTRSIMGTRMHLLTMVERGPKVQPAHKIEIVNREIEELQTALEKFRQHARHVNYILRCRNEELSNRLQEIIDNRNYFENKLLAEGIDPLTGKLPGEKFIRYMEMKLLSEDSEIDKIRIKMSSARNQLKRIEQQLMHKAEIGEILHAIDFEQLKIENQDCQERLDEKILHLTEVKRINGRCGTILNFNLKKLQEKIGHLKKLQKTIEAKEKMMEQLRVDQDRVMKEMSAAEKSVERINSLMKSFTVPSVMDYIAKKAEIHDLKKEIKICERQLKLKDLALAIQAQKLRLKMDATYNLMKKKSSKRFSHY